MRVSVCLSALLLANPATAQDCTRDDLPQQSMNACARQAWQAADEDLNLAYRIARDAARRMDQYIGEGEVPAVDTLREAQLHWIGFRDKACETESTLMRGGTAAPLLLYACMERLTRQRTEDLRYFGEVN